MPFSVGVDLPGSAWESFLHPDHGLAASLAGFGKGIGTGLDLAFGFDDETRRARREMAVKAAGKDPSFFWDDFGNATETPSPDLPYGGVDGSDLGKDAAGGEPDFGAMGGNPGAPLFSLDAGGVGAQASGQPAPGAMRAAKPG